MKLRYLLPTLLLGLSSALGQNTQLTGTISNPDGSGFTGTLYLSISQVAGVSPNNSCGGPVQVAPNSSLIISLVNGTMAQYQVTGSTTIVSGAPKMYGSDCTLPAGVPYIAQLKDPQGNTAFNQLWLIVGTTQDIGTVTSNVPNPQALYLSIIPAQGAPTGVCSNTQVYLQTDATPGINTWWCVNGTWTQQSGGGGGGGSGMAIGGAISGGSSGSLLYVSSLTELAQDNANLRYDPIATRLTVTNLTVTNAIIASITGNSATSTTAGSLTTAPTNCTITDPGTAATGITATGAPSSCIGIISPAGATNEIQSKAAGGGLQGSGLIANLGTNVTALVPIILAADPSTALGAATKQYVDNIAAGFTGAILSGPSGSQSIIQPDGTSFAITNAGVTTGVGFQLGAHVNFSMGGGTVSLKSPDGNSTLTLDNTGLALQPGNSAYLTLAGRIAFASANLNSSTTIGANGEYIDYVDATSGALSETLPAAAASTTGRQTFLVSKVDSTTNHVTIVPGSGDTINGTSSTVLGSQFNAVTLVSDGVHNWTISAGFVSSGILLQTNSSNNTNQSLLNLSNGPGINITEINGKVSITNTFAQNPTPPGIFQNVDWPPSIANAMNDEFTDATFNTSNIWTIINQGSDTINNINSLLSIHAVAHSGDNFVGIYQLTPSTPYAVTAKITLTGLDATGYYGGLAVRDSATGKVVAFRIGNGSTLTVDHFTNPTTLAGNVFSQVLDADQTIYLTIKDDGTNLTFSFSRDGVNFITVYAEGRTAFLAVPGQVGYMTGSSNASNAMAMGSDWFRRTL